MSSKRQKLFVRIMCVILALLMVGSVLTIALSTTAGAASQSKLNQLKNELKDIQQQKAEVKAEINSLKYDQAQALEKKQMLDQRIALTEQTIENLDEQITEYGRLIDEKQVELEQRQADEDAQWELYKVRVRAMQENGTVSYFAIIFGAKSFSDMLNRIQMINSIMDYDEKVYNDLVAKTQATEDAKADLETARDSMEGVKEEQIAAQAELEQEMADADALIQEITSDINQAQDFYDAVSDDEDKVKDDIAKMEKELARASGSTVKGTGKFRWPADSNVVTSTFGPRNTGIKGASTNHKGLDIKAGYGAKIYAADSGTVLVSTKSSSYGNYVTISHGNGYTTLYGHMSKRAVSKGDKVTKGQVIGYAGATGVANGPHLHFEVMLNGNRVNPLQFFDQKSLVIR